MRTKNKSFFMVFLIASFFFLTTPGVIAEGFNVETDGFTDKHCSANHRGETTVERFEFELEDEYDDEVYPVIHLEIDAAGDWLGRAENFQNFEFGEAEIVPVPGEHNEFDVNLESKYTGEIEEGDEDDVDYCRSDFEATLELKDEDFRASSDLRTFNINLHALHWDGSEIILTSDDIEELEQRERVTKDYRSIFIEHDGRWIELPNLGGYEPEWGLPYNCETGQCITEQLNEHTELLQYDLTEQEIWNFYWPPYETNTYNVVSEYEQCRLVHEEVEDIVIEEEGSLSTEDTGMQSYCPLTESYVADTPDENVHEILRNLEDTDYDLVFTEDWIGERLSLEIDITGSGEIIVNVDGEEVDESPVTSSTTLDIEEESLVSLEAVPEEGNALSSWDGECEGEGSECTIEMVEEKSTTAHFTGESVDLIIDNPDGDSMTYNRDIDVEWESINNFVEERTVEETEIKIIGEGNEITLDKEDMEELDSVEVDDTLSRSVSISEDIYGEATALAEDIYQTESWTLKVTDYWDDGEEITESVSFNMEPEPLPSNECMEQLSKVENQIPDDRRGPELDPPMIGTCGVEGSNFEETVYRENIKNELENMGWSFREEGSDQASVAGRIASVLWDAIKITLLVSLGYGLVDTIVEDIRTDADEISIDEGFSADDLDMDDEEFSDVVENDEWNRVVEASDDFDTEQEAREAGFANHLRDNFIDSSQDMAEWTYEYIVKPFYLEGAMTEIRNEMMGVAPDDIDPYEMPDDAFDDFPPFDDDTTTDEEEYYWGWNDEEEICEELDIDTDLVDPDGSFIFETEEECEEHHISREPSYEDIFVYREDVTDECVKIEIDDHSEFVDEWNKFEDDGFSVFFTEEECEEQVETEEVYEDGETVLYGFSKEIEQCIEFGPSTKDEDEMWTQLEHQGFTLFRDEEDCEEAL